VFLNKLKLCRRTSAWSIPRFLGALLRRSASAAAATLLLAGGAAAQNAAGPEIVTSPSGIEQPEDIGVRARPSVELFPPAGGYPREIESAVGPPHSGFLFETPASVACAYELVPVTAGCNPYKVTTNPKGGSRAIAFVDAYDDSLYAATDLAAFDRQFGIAHANLTVIFGTGNPKAGCKNGSKPPPAAGKSGNWDLEEALDVEWAHAFAPSAKLYLVEAKSNLVTDLLNAEKIAAACVQDGQIANGWGASEFSGENANDAVFTAKNIVYFAAAGDDVGVLYPAASPNVIGVGGSAFSRDQITGEFHSQASWGNQDLFLFTNPPVFLGTGGGPSAFERRPGFQKGVAALVRTARGTPDLGGIAGAATRVWVYSTTACSGWCGVFGTSVATATTAAIFNQLGLFFPSSGAALTAIYHNIAKIRTMHIAPILNGNCGPPGAITKGGFPNGLGQPYDPQWNESNYHFAYNYCTGWGYVH
jgi:subtilase family serine protease